LSTIFVAVCSIVASRVSRRLRSSGRHARLHLLRVDHLVEATLERGDVLLGLRRLGPDVGRVARQQARRLVEDLLEAGDLFGPILVALVHRVEPRAEIGDVRLHLLAPRRTSCSRARPATTGRPPRARARRP